MDARNRNVALAAVGAIALSVGLVAVNAAADDRSAGTAGATSTALVLTVTPQGGTGHSATLNCPAGGTHPDAQGACDALDAAGGDFTKVKPTSGQMCPHIVRPVTASASGTYRGKPESWMQTFNNSCELDRATHPIFAF